jgi:transaldolase
MKFFVDTANTGEIRKVRDWGMLDGVTTNPTLVAREKRDLRGLIGEIVALTPGPVSVEVLATDAEGMVREAREYARWGPNIVVKVPITPEGLRAVVRLEGERIPTNVTLVFSPNQAILAAKAQASYVSPFIGRLDDAGQDGMGVVREILAIYRQYGMGTRVIVASIRHPLHVTQAALAGAHAATIPFGVMEKLFSHPLTDTGLEAFMKDGKGSVPR